MKRISKILKSEKGASIIETLVALGFISIVATSFLNLAITARKMSFRYRVQNELARYAGMISEEVVKDYTLGNPVYQNNYCPAAGGGGGEIGVLVGNFLSDLDNPECYVTPTVFGQDGNYTISLGGEVFGKRLSVNRYVILK